MRVLIAGSTGYIGRRLLMRLMEEEGLEIRLLVRNAKAVSSKVSQKVQIVQGDAFDKKSLEKAMDGVDVCYYLLHPLSSKDYKQKDRQLAQNFVDRAQSSGVKRIIYLGGLGVEDENTSEHLLSRIETGKVLSSSKSVQTL